MSLSVNAYEIGQSPYKSLPTPPREPHNELFGFESWRSVVWGCAYVKDLGCTLLPTLNGFDLMAQDEHLDQLEAELKLLKDHLPELSAATQRDADAIAFRIGNALAAVELARQHGNAGVCIS